MIEHQHPSLVSIGDNVVDCYLDLGWMFPGGNAVNVAVHAARLGIDSAYIGALGADAAGRCVHAALRDENVDTTGVRVVPGANAFATVRLVDGDRVFGTGNPGVSEFVPDDDQLALVAQADVVHTGECSMLEDHIGALRDRAALLSFDFSVRPWDYIATYAPLADIAVCSMPDDVSADERVDALAALGPSIAVVTKGADGATMRYRGEKVDAQAGDGPIVDTLGAGDAFIARLLVGVLRGEEPHDLLRKSSRYATSCCAEHGAFGHRCALNEDPGGSPASSITYQQEGT